jgi:hypothetical protein
LNKISGSGDKITINSNAAQLGWWYWLKDYRAQVYLLWAVIVASGYVILHSDPDESHIVGWLVASAAGFAYMLYVMPLRQAKMRAIFASWLVPITIGFILTIAAFESSVLNGLIPYLGILWAILQAVGFTFNGLVDPPSRWYWFGALSNILLAGFLIMVPALLSVQYALLAVVTTWAMINLWLFRSNYI